MKSSAKKWLMVRWLFFPSSSWNLSSGVLKFLKFKARSFLTDPFKVVASYYFWFAKFMCVKLLLVSEKYPEMRLMQSLERKYTILSGLTLKGQFAILCFIKESKRHCLDRWKAHNANGKLLPNFIFKVSSQFQVLQSCRTLYVAIWNAKSSLFVWGKLRVMNQLTSLFFQTWKYNRAWLHSGANWNMGQEGKCWWGRLL